MAKGSFLDSRSVIPSVPTDEEIGSTGLHEFDGVVHEEILRRLQWPNGNKVWREMSDNDPVVGSILFAVEMLIRGVKWRIEPADDSSVAVSRAEFVQTMIDDMEKPWSEVINDILSFLPFGFAVHETVYKKRLGPNQDDPRFHSRYDDGLWAWRKLPSRAQDTVQRWVYRRTDTGVPRELVGVEQLPPNGGPQITIPRERFLLFRVNSKKDNPESRSVLRNAYRPWFFKKRIEEIEAIGIERDLAGLPIALIPPMYMSPEATKDQKAVLDAVKTIVTSVRNNEQAGVVFPLSYDDNGNKIFDFKLLGRENGSSRAFDTEKIIQRYDKRIAGTILADFILLGQQSVGSFALSSDKTKLFAAAIGAWLESIASVLNSEGLPRLWKLNGWDLSTMPQFAHGDIEKQELEKIAEYFNKLAVTGLIMPDEDLENWFRGLADAPPRDEESTLLPTKATGEDPEGNGDSGGDDGAASGDSE